MKRKVFQSLSGWQNHLYSPIWASGRGLLVLPEATGWCSSLHGAMMKTAGLLWLWRLLLLSHSITANESSVRSSVRGHFWLLTLLLTLMRQFRNFITFSYASPYAT